MFLYELYKQEYLCYVDKSPKKLIITKSISNISYNYVFYTISHNTLDYLFDMFSHINDKDQYIKGLYNKQYIYDNFNELLLVIWLMDDGTNQNRHIKFCIDYFTLSDCQFLQYILLNKFNIKSNLHFARNRSNKEQYRIYIVAKSMPTLINLVLPYMCLSMLYKLGHKFYKS